MRRVIATMVAALVAGCSSPVELRRDVEYRYGDASIVVQEVSFERTTRWAGADYECGSGLLFLVAHLSVDCTTSCSLFLEGSVELQSGDQTAFHQPGELESRAPKKWRVLDFRPGEHGVAINFGCRSDSDLPQRLTLRASDPSNELDPDEVVINLGIFEP